MSTTKNQTTKQKALPTECFFILQNKHFAKLYFLQARSYIASQLYLPTASDIAHFVRSCGLKLLAVYSALTAHILQQHKAVAFVKAMCARIVTANTESNPFYAFCTQMLF